MAFRAQRLSGLERDEAQTAIFPSVLWANDCVATPSRLRHCGAKSAPQPPCNISFGGRPANAQACKPLSVGSKSQLIGANEQGPKRACGRALAYM